MTLKDFYRTGKFKPDYSTYGGEIYYSDFCTDFSGDQRKESLFATRIASDARFDEMCKKNIESRDRKDVRGNA